LAQPCFAFAANRNVVDRDGRRRDEPRNAQTLLCEKAYTKTRVDERLAVVKASELSSETTALGKQPLSTPNSAQIGWRKKVLRQQHKNVVPLVWVTRFATGCLGRVG
jgi:hypothetical protein